MTSLWDEAADGGKQTEELIPVSRMAQMHGVSRQTLLLYDREGLFKPYYVTQAGYRYYSVYQIPYLREICFLRKLGLSLERIKEHMNRRSPESACQMLREQQAALKQQIRQLEEKQAGVEQRLQIISNLNVKFRNLDQPYVEWCTEQKGVFVPFGTDQVDRKQLHLTLMKAWNILNTHSMLPSQGFGAIPRYESCRTGNYLHQAGSIVRVPDDTQSIQGVELYTLPAGEYVTMYKFGMPYELEPVKRLLAWIEKNGFEVTGDILDVCLLDTTFYDERHKVDFCQLRVPIREKDEQESLLK